MDLLKKLFSPGVQPRYENRAETNVEFDYDMLYRVWRIYRQECQHVIQKFGVYTGSKAENITDDERHVLKELTPLFERFLETEYSKRPSALLFYTHTQSFCVIRANSLPDIAQFGHFSVIQYNIPGRPPVDPNSFITYIVQ